LPYPEVAYEPVPGSWAAGVVTRVRRPPCTSVTLAIFPRLCAFSYITLEAVLLFTA
jgi:hypothetical protein